MGRFQLFEFEDQPWFPHAIRDGMTDYLKFVANHFDFYKSVVPVIAKGLKASGGSAVIDLASGGGGGWDKLTGHLLPEFADLKVTLTDLFPNKEGLASFAATKPGVFSVSSNPVDARDVPAELTGLRTQFLSLHHFKPEDATRILQNAVDAGQPVAIFEAQKRDVIHFIKFALSPIGVLLMMPFVRPFRWSQLLFTYLIPVIPICTFWDGLVSVLRTYSASELEQMTNSLQNGDSFLWEIGESKSGQVTVPCLLGIPRK